MIADAVWLGGRIRTMDPDRPWAEALAVAGGRLLAVGTDADIEHLAGPGTQVHRLHGRAVMPGLVESHTHALWGACRDLFDVYVGYAASLADLLAATRTRADQIPPGTAISGGPWRHEMRPDMGPVPRQVLDRISDQHPIILKDTSQHVIWCNTRALDLAGLTADAADIPGGVIERDASGAPTGILAENACAPVLPLLKYSQAQLAEAARAFVHYFNRFGFTAFKEPMAVETDLATYRDADVRGELTLHAAAHIVRQSPMATEPVPYDEMDRMRAAYASDNLRTGFAKLFIDGVAPGHTASFTDPYLASSGYDVASHDPDATLLLDPETLNATVTELDRRGYVVKMHTVGDNAIRRALDAIEAARRTNGFSGLRHETAHSVFVSDSDLSRYRALDAVAEQSPKLWMPNPATPAQVAVLGRDRLEKSHRMADLLRAGAEMTYASDWPASAPDANPWTGLAGMLTRRDPTGRYDGTIGAAQALTLDQALPLFTTNGARSLGMESETGSLSAGKWADFVVLEQDPGDLGPEEIGAIAPLNTVWKGRTVHTA